MKSPDGQPGRPSEKAAGPEKRATAEARSGPEVTLFINDRLDAIERALGTVRRRQMTLRIASLTRRADDLVLVFRADQGARIPQRWIAELSALVDVRQVRVRGIPAAAP